ncbi:MAG TPA: DUF2127 domain-containing protein [Candidatus Paceibacterota bacterium]|nr:DUF2127 domain-containing protein [Candidatus Paceibacterota bacterium]
MVAVFLKLLDGILQVVLGFLLLLFSDQVSWLVLSLINNALIDDPDNFFVTHVRTIVLQPHHAYVFGGLYMIAHGVAKTFVSGALLRNFAWAYPVAIAFFGFFIFYEFVHIAMTGSVPFMFLAVFDIATLWLTIYDFQHSRHRS